MELKLEAGIRFAGGTLVRGSFVLHLSSKHIEPKSNAGLELDVRRNRDRSRISYHTGSKAIRLRKRLHKSRLSIGTK